ncbi:hypothetical protein [Xenophilus sp. Marseille-Q4582]|uniref:hypothetical protein n=1 Tax=Xenophilus sp. Marseille-Q4582 TaxID=2866600 RepID=UPI001CE3C637|nr:hypothetical protein [Xenophilus sp. Marseille-Q4582]
MTAQVPSRPLRHALSQQALRVIGVTAVAWGVQLPSAHAIARRAPHGHVPLRTLRRLRAAVRLIHPAPVLAHSW